MRLTKAICLAILFCLDRIRHVRPKKYERNLDRIMEIYKKYPKCKWDLNYMIENPSLLPEEVPLILNDSNQRRLTLNDAIDCRDFGVEVAPGRPSLACLISPNPVRTSYNVFRYGYTKEGY